MKRLRFFVLCFLMECLPAAAQVQWPVVDSVARPWTRWWWMGSAVDTFNLRVNMERYRAAGLGGLELTPIYGVKGYEGKFIDYLSPKWMDMFAYTLGQARRLGLGMDMSTGTGWPFGGGPLIDSQYACKEMFYKEWGVKGGEVLRDTVRFVQEKLVTFDQVRLPVPLRLICLMGFGGWVDGAGDRVGDRSGDQVVDLTGMVDAAGRLKWTAPAGRNWRLYGLFLGAHGKMVERAAPGAEGNVIDHFSVTALKRYLSRFDTAFKGRSLDGLRSMFNDSYEVDDSRGQSNWTPGFFADFLRLRGYDLREHLEALLGRGDSVEGVRVLCDYRETISELLLTQFTRPWADWAHGYSKLVRDQAHGSPANILDLYAASDIPETEGEDILRYKFAVSAAHVTGKRLVSAEAATWLNEHFISNYGDVRQAVDHYLLGGVNHIVYHGTAYSPTGDPWPGWLFYASVHFTPADPSWQHFHVLNEYVARCQASLQQGEPDNEVLLYYPQYDSWSDRGRDLLKHYDRMAPEFNGTGFSYCAQRLPKEGIGFDYISDRQLQDLSLGHRYKAIILPGCRYMPVETMRRLVELSKAGVKVIVYGGLPSDVPGWWKHEDRRAQLRRMGDSLRTAGYMSVVDSLSFGKSWEALGLRRERMVEQGLEFVRRKYEDGYLYFIVNRGGKAFDGMVEPASGGGACYLQDPMTGAEGVAAMAGNKVRLQLGIGGSVLLRVVRGGATCGKRFAYWRMAGNVHFVRSGWTLELEGRTRVLDSLGSWTLLGAEAAVFSGTGVYSVSFSRPGGRHAFWKLDLGRVAESAEVILNGQKIGASIGPAYSVLLPDSALHVLNLLEVRVSNSMVNRIIDMDKRGVRWKKFYNVNFPAHDRVNRGADGLFDASKWEPRASGLLGPVTLQGLKDPCGVL